MPSTGLSAWWAAAPKSRWPEDDDALRAIIKDWQEPFGDRRQQIVYIGQDLPKDAMLAELHGCLLTDEEMRLEPVLWGIFPDPFPAWLASSGEAGD